MLDWDDLRFFLAISRERTLSAAAKRLHVTQSTVGRRLAAMQASLGVRLLARTADGFQLTLAGEAILAHVERVEAEALLLEQAVGGQDRRLAGLVRVASPPVIANHLLAPCLAAMQAENPSIVVESLAWGRLDALAGHHAEIALRLARFDQGDLVVRSLGTLQFALYGSLDYLAQHGDPDLESGSPGHRLVTLLDEIDLPMHSEWLAQYAGRAHVVLRSDCAEMQHFAVLSGSGLALLPRFRADANPALRRLTTLTPPPAAELWLGVHRENRHTPRIRVVLDSIAAAVRARAGELDPASMPAAPAMN